MCRVVWRLLTRTMSHGLQLQFFLLLLQFLQCAQSSGIFELQLLEMSNPRSVLSGAEGCCGGGGPSPPCHQECRTRFSLCLKEYQTSVTSGGCSFGNTTSPVLGDSSFTLADPDKATMLLPFTFRWTRSFTLILQALDDYNSTDPEASHLIEEASYSGIILPSVDWHTLEWRGTPLSPSSSRIAYRVRVRCNVNYYNATCTKFCRPRDDKFGHYKCGPDGDKRCMPGWKGDRCEDAVCKPGCHPVHGRCDVPGECECRQGWQGDLCDQCKPYPGCKHGYCNGSSWQCICDTNWGGILCDQDLNYCGTHEPCSNGGTCENTAPDQFRCSCLEGFSGAGCEVVDNPCAPAPCLHGGLCMRTPQGFSCACAPGWTGDTCETNIDECASAPCQNGGTCIDLENAFQCSCPSTWEGDLCQFDVDECMLEPCINALSCVNLAGGYQCQCRRGWEGKDCDRNINDCTGQCLHGATCIDLVNDFHCACQPGYTGSTCATNVDDCALNPCLNGGECVDQVNAYRCICPVGYNGLQCEDDRDHCTPNPCENNAACFNTQGDYYCHCSSGWRGRNCSHPRTPCDSPPCQGVEACPGGCGEHGRCAARPTGGFHCACDPGFSGKYCHENINDCKYNPCQNGGTCVDKINSFQCICREGWQGDLCSINADECNPNPCRNNGTCVDGIADFSCICRDGWKGKTCNLKDSHCDYTTCRNGGTCQDLGSTFACRCPPQWGGTACHIAKMPACRSNPCMNGATCVNTGDFYNCICKEGFEGLHCENDINECISQPCYNGGKCIDGLNWFLCECAAGFSGPDCRINVNECASSPCGRGATCLDGIGSYQCLCPPGRDGTSCEQDVDSEEWNAVSAGSIGGDEDSRSCLWRGHYHPANSSWQSHCNTCWCLSGRATCTHVWCGLPDCLAPQARPCQSNQVCVPVGENACLRPTCEPIGECRDVEARRVAPPPLPAPANCWPNQAALSNRCARISLVMSRGMLLPGTSAEGVCRALRLLLAAAHARALVSQGQEAPPLVLLCDVKRDTNDTVEVTLSSLSEDSDRSIIAGVRILGEQISRKQSGTASPLSAVVEVKAETAVVQQELSGGHGGGGSGWLAAAGGGFAAILAAGVAGGLYCLQRRRRAGDMQQQEQHHHRHHDDDKSNNLQNEENFRRYANPLKEDSIGNSLNDSMSCLKGAGAAPQAPNECGKLRRPLSEAGGGAAGSGLALATPGGSRAGSQILLYKPQNPDVRNNTMCDDPAAHKDFAKRVINMNVLPSTTNQNGNNQPAEVLTVLV